MISRTATWREFVDSGVYWFVVRIMNVFGWTLVLHEEGNDIVRVTPARVQGTFSHLPLEESQRVAFLRSVDPKIAEVLTDPAELPEEDRELVGKVESLTVDDA